MEMVSLHAHQVKLLFYSLFVFVFQTFLVKCEKLNMNVQINLIYQ